MWWRLRHEWLAFFGALLCDRPGLLVAVCGEESDGGCDSGQKNGESVDEIPDLSRFVVK